MKKIIIKTLIIVMLILCSLVAAYAEEPIYGEFFEATGHEENMIIYTNIVGLNNLILFSPNPVDYTAEDLIVLDGNNTIANSNGEISIVLTSPIEMGRYMIVTKSDKTETGEKVVILVSEFKTSPELETLTAAYDAGKVTVDWREKNNFDDTYLDTKVKMMLIDDPGDPTGEVLEESLNATGTAMLELPTNLPNGTYYILACIEREDVGYDYMVSNGFEYVNPLAPSVVMGFDATYLGNSLVKFSWEAMADIDQFYIYYTNGLGSTNYIEVSGEESSVLSVDFKPGLYDVGIYATKMIDGIKYVGEKTAGDLLELSEISPPQLKLSFTTTGDMTEKYTELGGEAFVQYFIDERNLTLAGTSDKNADIKIYINDEGDDAPVYVIDDTMDFAQNIDLMEDGDYSIKIVATADNGDQEQYYYNFEVDTTAPYLEVTSPLNGDTVSDTFILVSGQSEPSCTLRVNGMTIDMDEEGYFNFELLPSYSLANIVSIVAEDYAGNAVEYEASLANETHEITGFKMTAEKAKMYDGETQLIYGVVTDILGNDNILSCDNIHYEIVEGDDIARLDDKGKLYADGTGQIIIKGVFIGSSELIMEGEVAIEVAAAPDKSFNGNNHGGLASVNVDKLYSQKIKADTGGSFEIPKTAMIEFTKKSLVSDTRFEGHIVDANKEGIKLPSQQSMKLESGIVEIKSSEDGRFGEPVKLSFYCTTQMMNNPDAYGIYYYDEVQKVWLYVGGEIEDGKITTEINHLTKFAVFYNKSIKKMNDMNTHWAKKYVQTLVGRGIINGFPDGMNEYSFKPDHPITRAEFITLAVKMYGLDLNIDYNVNFADYEEIPDWAMPYMQAAYAKGMLTGLVIDGETYLKPNADITRQEIVTLLGKGYTDQQAGKSDFKDANQIDYWAKPYVDQMVALGVINGRPDHSFAPKALATRAESAIILFKLIELIESED